MGPVLTPCPGALEGGLLAARQGCAVGHLSPYRQACTEPCLENTARDSAVFTCTISRGRAEKVTLFLVSMIFSFSCSRVFLDKS